jgi:hypothetical protein
MPAAPAVPEAVAVAPVNGAEPAADAKPRRTTRTPKAEQPERDRAMPDAIGHAPRRRTPRKPKEVTE